MFLLKLVSPFLFEYLCVCTYHNNIASLMTVQVKVNSIKW